MAGLARKGRSSVIGLVLIVSAGTSIGSSASAAVSYRSGNPPVIIKASFDSQRRLEVVFRADDGLTFGGTIYLDSNPLNGEPPAYVDTTYGNFMYCNNKSNCVGHWTLTPTSETGPFTFHSEPLDPVRFPKGTYYLQVETHNEDPYPSTRMWELSPVSVLLLTTSSGSASLDVGKLEAISLPIDNGSERCSILRKKLSVGNRLATAINNSVEKLNAALTKVKNPSTKLRADLASSAAWIDEVSAMRAADLTKANVACGTAPELVGLDGSFTPIPVPPSNGKSACTKVRNQLNYLNQELTKVVNNISTTKLSQAVRIRQLRTRFIQLSTNLSNTWPTALKSCTPA